MTADVRLSGRRFVSIGDCGHEVRWVEPAKSVPGLTIVKDEQPSPVESYVPFMPNVLKVFLENGQTKSF
ncbi:hypothetical protein BaRGS_00018895, partial [Batillaria attramentaria]